MPSAVEAYMLAKADRDKLNQEVAELISLVHQASEMFKKSPSHWNIGPPRKNSAWKSNDPINIDPDELTNLDPLTWPTAQQFIQLKQKYAAAEKNVQTTYNALSTLEKSAIRKP
jgi:hypothetical protein